MYKDLNLTACNNYNDIYSFPFAYETSKGFGRENFVQFERLTRTRNKCLPPCSTSHYDVEFKNWEDDGFTDDKHTTLQIAFDDFAVLHREEYFSCDMTCIIGEIGGNAGLFLGADILILVDYILPFIITTIFANIAEKIYRMINNH